MVNEEEFNYHIKVYQYLQLCKRLRQPTWQKQIHEYHGKLGWLTPQISDFMQTLQLRRPLVNLNLVFALHPEFQVLMAVNSMVNTHGNNLSKEQKHDLDWFYLSLLQRWLKKHADHKLVKNIAIKHQSHLEIIDQLIDKVMHSDPSETLLLQFTLPLNNGEICNIRIDEAWIHLNNSLKNIFTNLQTTYPDMQISFIKKLSLSGTNPMFCGCLYITHAKAIKRTWVTQLLLDTKIESDKIRYIAHKPLISKADFFTRSQEINTNLRFVTNEPLAQWKQENRRIKDENTKNKNDLRQSLFNVLNPFEELIFQVNLDGPLIDQRHKKRFFSSSLAK